MKRLTPSDRAAAYASAFPRFPRLIADGRWLLGVFTMGAWYRGNGFGGCLPPDARVLTADLRWIPQGDVRVGDELVGVNEYPIHQRKRRLEPATVLAVGPVRLPSLRIELENGRSFICSADHRWLRLKTDGCAVWTESRNLRPGHGIRRLVEPWSSPDSYEAGWMAGIIDGEGSVSTDSGFRVSIYQNEGPVLKRVVELLAKWGVRATVKPHHQTYDVRTGDAASSLGLLGRAWSLRLGRRWIGVGLPVRDGAIERIKKVTFAGDQDLVGMLTSTRTFIADGLVSHNSYPPGYLPRMQAMFPDVWTPRGRARGRVLHLFSGSLSPRVPGVRVDLRRSVGPDVAGDAQRLPFSHGVFDHVLADPPYSDVDAATRYRTSMPDRRRVLYELARVVRRGGHLVWMDEVLPIFAKRLWHWWGVIGMTLGTNRRGRFIFMFERVGGQL